MLKIFCSDTKQHIYSIGLGVTPSNSAAIINKGDNNGKTLQH